MTDMITYEHSAAVTLSLPVKLESFAVEGIKEGLQVYGKTDKATTTVNDPNRVRRRFTFNCVLSRANTVTMLSYVQPAAALTYGTYPRFSVMYIGDATTETNVKVVNTAFTYRAYGRDGTDIQYLWTLTFEERF